MIDSKSTTPMRSITKLLAVGAAALTLNSCAYDGVKVIVINMFQGEAQPFIDRYDLKEKVYISGLSPDAPNMLCNVDGICQVTTGMGYANAASTISALLYRSKLDLTHTYFVIAGIAGIDPGQGTVGSAAWARYAVDYGLSHEIDAREMPASWPYGYFGIGTKGPGQKPPLDYRTEVFQLNETLLQKAFTLSKSATLEDSPEAIAFRKNYAFAPANQPPAVIQCDVASADTWWAGRNLGQRARDWVKTMTDNKGTYCTTAQEDNATLEVLTRGARAGKVDFSRVALLRAGSDFDRPYDGQTATDGLINYAQQGGFVPATHNLVNAAKPLLDDIVDHWARWKQGVPN
ncbi:purine-nucleoside phosphorylase [Ralstonia insidiosa]|uniref:purine-nucleoside phosphorylase n=1 Tax=Ralstonia insidiosa TaxID=190721 RepID=UPI000CEEEB7E|nr:purine nucleoside permease [Ralstonia insidiosa]